jgi:hypothetical protein
MGLVIYGSDVWNAYLQVPSSEKHYIICGQEFGLENVPCCALIQQALYDSKVAGADFWHHLWRRITWASLSHVPIQICGSEEQNKQLRRRRSTNCLEMYLWQQTDSCLHMWLRQTPMSHF